MTFRRPGFYAALVFIAALPACSEPMAPDAAETVAVLVDHRALTADDRLPSVQVTARQRGVTVRVARPAFCATIVKARVARGRRELDVVTRVAGNPAALCASIPAVVDYSVTVDGIGAGIWSVRVFEAVADGPPRFLRQVRVRIA